MARLAAFNFQEWIEDHKHLLKPPVGNQKVFEESDMVVMGGGRSQQAHRITTTTRSRNSSTSSRGDMLLKIHDGEEFYDVPIREGEVFLLPPHVRHSPQRPQEGSIGLVVEPKRQEGQLDAIEWYCFECGTRVHRAEMQLKSIVKDLPPVYEAFYTSEEARTCPNCGAVHPGKEPPEGWVTL